MADLDVVNPAVAQGVANDPQTVNAGGDRFAATRGRKYLLRANNAHTSSHTITIDDPTSGPGVIGAATPQNPDVPIVVPNATVRVHLIDADRHADANGWVNLTYSASPTALTLELYGPL